MKKKFYKKAEPKKSKQFPSNSRFIPEKIFSDHFVFFVGVFCILLAILVVSLDLYNNYKKQKQLADENIKILNQLVFWQNEIEKRPNYRDAYFSLALLNYQLKDFNNASKNLQKALSLDPNFEKGRELGKILNSKY